VKMDKKKPIQLSLCSHFESSLTKYKVASRRHTAYGIRHRPSHHQPLSYSRYADITTWYTVMQLPILNNKGNANQSGSVMTRHFRVIFWVLPGSLTKMILEVFMSHFLAWLSWCTSRVASMARMLNNDAHAPKKTDKVPKKNRSPLLV
jgi:hypothetical protein